MNKQVKHLLSCTLGLALLLPLASSASGQDASGKTPSVSDLEDSGVSSRGAGDIILLKPPALPPQVMANLPGPAPANVSLTAVTPTNIMIQWSPSPGAVRYVISRNGAPDIPIEANAGFLQGNRFVYTDVGRRPAMLHTYSVIAQFPPPVPPGRSAPVLVFTPPALPPQNLKATVSGPGAVSLNWMARPEATSYRILRTGGGLQSTVLNVSGQNYIDQSLPPGDYTYSIYSVMRLASGEELTGEHSNPVTIRPRYFNIVALGDSIMWGQGLSYEHKFANKIRDWIASQVGKTVNPINMKAHSGAITYPNPELPLSENTSYDGEIPTDWPTISHQIGVASNLAMPASEVDLALVDGCINNVQVLNVLNPFLDDGVLRTDTWAYCREGMTNVLTEVVRAFPNAKIIVPGYYPITSWASDVSGLIPIFMLIGANPIIPDPSLGALYYEAARLRVITRSDIFFQESNSSLQTAVAIANGLPLEGRTKFNQIRFAPLRPGPENAYAGPNAWLWLIPTPPLGQDEMYAYRYSQCKKLQDPPSPFCIDASAGHPNVAGARAYTDAITSIAAQFIPEWRTAHATSVTTPDDSLVVKVHAGLIDSSGGAMIVTATDGPSGPPLQGTVQLNGVPVGALGEQVRYAYQQYNPTDIVVGVNVPNRPSRSFTIPVRKQSLAVNLTHSGDPRSLIVTATDSVTGQVLNGNVMVHTTSNQVSGPTGQSLSYPSCGQTNQTQRLNNVSIVPGPVPCTGTVRVPYYPDASFQDVSGTINLAIQTHSNILTKPGGP